MSSNENAVAVDDAVDIENRGDDGYFSWAKLEDVKDYITNELRKRGCELPDEWIPGEMAYDTTEFVHKDITYHLCLSCRRKNTFGFIIANKESIEQVVNKSITYDNVGEYKNEINQHLLYFGEPLPINENIFEWAYRKAVEFF